MDLSRLAVGGGEGDEGGEMQLHATGEASNESRIVKLEDSKS
jgi:hypothetical protein